MEFDVIVIGSGPGGYVSAIRAAQLGMKTAIIERYPTLGGTCLNVGCIPSKALLQSSELFHEASTSFTNHGIGIEKVSLDLEKMMARKSDVVKGLTEGVAYLMKKNEITVFHGHGKLCGEGKVEVKGEETRTIEGTHIILATGSKPIELPFLPYDDDVVSSTGALAFDAVPEHLLVVGGGVIGLELGSVWSRLGAKVTVIEFMDRILPPMDADVSKEMKRALTRQGLKFHLSTKVTGAKRVDDGKLEITAENKKGKTLSFTVDKVLVSVGRKPYTEGLGLENAGIDTDDRGFIPTDAHLATKAKGIYAIGDVVGGLMLAHKAEDEGVALVERLAGKGGHMNYDAVPNIVYTWPEVASVGKTEAELKEAGIPYRVGTFPMKASSRGRCADQTTGMVKIIAHEETDRILGAHIVAANASELIAEAVLAVEYEASAEDLARTVHGHPTLSEAIREAALAVDGRARQI